MGASQSKRTFVPDVPVAFSQDLIESLEDTPETDFSRVQDKALKLEQSVAAELESLSGQAKELVLSAWNDADSAPVKGEIVSPAVLKDITTLKDAISSHKAAAEAKAETGKTFNEHREKLIKCLQTNDRRPLVCLAEFNEFKDKLESTLA
ncbi:hypothetical protein V1512DRAFT_264185 [Lipomyces arxii]|uniref:uncharacterized protein n=1 Tax=Lipomyces arxii TaxID=56418 RepID=UPI0034CE465D